MAAAGGGQAEGMSMKFRYIRRMHNALRHACPEGYSVQVVRDGKRLFTIITCDDYGYFAPWSVREIVEPFGF